MAIGHRDEEEIEPAFAEASADEEQRTHGAQRRKDLSGTMWEGKKDSPRRHEGHEEESTKPKRYGEIGQPIMVSMVTWWFGFQR